MQRRLGALFQSHVALFAQLTVRPVSIAAARDPLSRFAGWAQLSSDVGAVMRTRHAGYIASNEHSIGATLAFYLRSTTVFQTSEAIRYEFMPPVDQELLRRTAGLYVAAPASDDLARLQAHFDSVELVSIIWRSRGGDPIDAYRVYELKGYRGGLPY